MSNVTELQHHPMNQWSLRHTYTHMQGEKEVVSNTSAFVMYSLMMYQSCAFVSISCNMPPVNTISQQKRTLIDSDNSVNRTKNWNPLSVNLGGSLSSLLKKA